MGKLKCKDFYTQNIDYHEDFPYNSPDKEFYDIYLVVLR